MLTNATNIGSSNLFQTIIFIALAWVVVLIVQLLRLAYRHFAKNFGRKKIIGTYFSAISRAVEPAPTGLTNLVGVPFDRALTEILRVASSIDSHVASLHEEVSAVRRTVNRIENQPSSSPSLFDRWISPFVWTLIGVIAPYMIAFCAAKFGFKI